MNFMSLEEKYSSDDSQSVIIPISYEKNVSYGKGTANGAKAIVGASKHLEYYDEQWKSEPYLNGIKTLPLLELSEKEDTQALKEIEKQVANQKAFTICLGGDHAITIGAMRGIDQRDDDYSLITIDAHPDFFHSWNGSQLNHRCVSARAVEKHKILLIGIRAMDKDEHELIENDDRIDMVKAYEYSKEKVKEKLAKLSKKVYLSIDVDGIDPSVISQTGTPEPGGFFWNQLIDLLAVIFEEKEVIAADVVEFAPTEEENAQAYTLAKLVYKLVALKQKNA